MNEELKISLVLSIIYYTFLLEVTVLNYASTGLMKTIFGRE